MSLLTDLISEQFTIIGRGKFLKTLEHDSLVINVEDDMFFWNSKEISGGAYAWLTKILGYSKRDAVVYLRENRGSLKSRGFTKLKSRRGEITVYPKLVKLLWDNGKKNREYWYKRGITDATCDRFLLGYYEGWYTIPFFVDGKIVNFQKRRDEPEKQIISWYVGVGHVLFNSAILKLMKTVILTESPTDAILLSQHGYPALSHNGGAGFWNASWNKFFTDQKEIFIVYDNDDVGRSGSKKIAENLGEYRSRIYTFEGHKDKYDLGDWLTENDPKEFGELLEAKAKRKFE